MSRNVGKNISKNLSGKYSHKLLNLAKQSVTNALISSSKRAIQKPAEETGDLIGNKIPDKIIEVSKTSPQNNPDTITNQRDKEIPKYIYIYI